MILRSVLLALGAIVVSLSFGLYLASEREFERALHECKETL